MRFARYRGGVIAFALLPTAILITWDLVRPEPYEGPSRAHGWSGRGLDPNVPYDRRYGRFGYMYARDHYTDYKSRQISGERLEWRQREAIYTLVALAGVWFGTGWGMARLTRRCSSSVPLS